MQITNENIEEYILLLADDELDGQEEAEVRQYIALHQAYLPMLNVCLAARLDADEEPYIFPDKESLLKPETVALPLKRNINPLRIAAALVLVIGIGTALTLMLSKNNTNDPEHAEPLQASKKVNTQTISPAKVIQEDTLQMATVMKSKTNNAIAPAIKHNIQSSKNNQSVNNTQLVAAHVEERKAATVPAQLEDATLNKVELSERPVEYSIAMTAQNTSGVRSRDGKEIPGWLPVNEENLQGINSLIAHIQLLKEGIQEKAQSLKNKAFVITIGDRQFSIGK